MLHVHTAERAEPLAVRLAEVLAEPPADPLAPEWIAVPTERMRRWLHLQLARHLGAAEGGADGVAANVRTAFPGSLRSAVLEAGLGRDEDPWQVDRLTWALLEVGEVHGGDDAAEVLVPPPAGGSRYGRARRVADLFDRYHVHRPEMVLAWSRGHDLDATNKRAAAHQRWQPRLWRLVREHLGEPSPPERLPALLDHARAGTLELDLPSRVVLFGLSVLPAGPGFVEVARAVATHRDLHLLLLEPSSAVAQRVGSAATADDLVRLRADDETVDRVDHPLLASWGRLHREAAVLLADARRGDLFTHQWAAPAADDEPATLLGRLQADLRADRAPDGGFEPDPADRSLQIHACYGATRQVEVLRDAVLHLLADPELDLSEDDVVVGCPDLARFAPVVEAVFGPRANAAVDAGGAEGPPALRYRIADRSLHTANPVAAALTSLLDLLGGRFEAPAVLDLLSLEPVRRRARLSDDDLAQVAEWVEEANVRWGLDAEHRARHGLGAALTANTWRHALDRLLVGVAVTDDEPLLALGDVAPLGAEADAATLAGRLAQLLWQLDRLADSARRSRPLGEWVAWLDLAATTLLADERDDGWPLMSLRALLAEVADDAELGGGSAAPLALSDLRRLLADRLEAPLDRPAYFRGGITVTDLTSLRWIPARVVCLLGMDQAALGTGAVDGDDLAAAAPRLGDRDPRGTSRQTLLETVLAAGERLLVLRDGHDLKTNQEVPAAVPVAELRDTVLATVSPAARDRVRARLEVAHPRQPYDPRCLVAEGIDERPGPWSFDPLALAGARARAGRAPAAATPFLAGPLPRPAEPVVELDALRRFLKHPVKAFFDRTLEVRFPERDDPLSARLPVELVELARWRVADRLLATLLSGGTVESWRHVEAQRGTLPPGVLGHAKVDEIVATVEQIAEAALARGLRIGPPQALPVEVTLDDGTRIVGSVDDRLVAPGGPALVTYSRLKDDHRVRAWLDLMVLVAAEPTTDWHAVAVGKNPGSSKKVLFAALDLAPAATEPDRRAADARTALAAAVACYRRGVCEPIPLFPNLSHELHEGKPRDDTWRDDYKGWGDGDDAPTGLAFPHDLDALRALPVEADDPDGPGHGRAERYAHLLWGAVDATVVERPAPDEVPA